MATARFTPNDLDDYSSSSTVIAFERPVPLLRGPLLASYESAAVPFVLAFGTLNPGARRTKPASANLPSSTRPGLESAALSALSRCKAPRWKLLFGGASNDFAEREKCEERETEMYFEAAKANCHKFSENKCLPAFRDSRITMKDQKVNWKEASKLILWVSLPLAASGGGLVFDLMGLDKMGTWNEFKDRLEVASYRGSDLLGNVTSFENLLDKG